MTAGTQALASVKTRLGNVFAERQYTCLWLAQLVSIGVRPAGPARPGRGGPVSAPMRLVLTGDSMPAQSLATGTLVWLSDSRLEAKASRCSTANRPSMNQGGIGRA